MGARVTSEEHDRPDPFFLISLSYHAVNNNCSLFLSNGHVSSVHWSYMDLQSINERSPQKKKMIGSAWGWERV
jgi:hypothetical protein